MSGELADTVVIVPARDEAGSIADVVSALRGLGVARVIVVDDASSDRTAAIARAAGADVVRSTVAVTAARVTLGSRLPGPHRSSGSSTGMEASMPVISPTWSA